MKRLLPSLTLVLLASAVLGSSLAAQSPQRVKRDRNRISQEEIQQSSASNLHDLVQGLRPHWLRIRGPSGRLQPAMSGTPASSGQPLVDPGLAATSSGKPLMELGPQEIFVYVDGVRFGNQETLRTLTVSDVASLEFLDASSATQRWGTGHPNGAIVVNRRTGGS
ncbi:MAG TPA: TonB-dependent receptor plug domain-containing protein [Longimicrobiaceae bacterium]|nr:TonB-dependent receptor plug domain-containing protein [Longimicrobiaceae bacterium]